MHKRLRILVNATKTVSQGIRLILCGTFMLVVIILLTPIIFLYPKIMSYLTEESNKIVNFLLP